MKAKEYFTKYGESLIHNHNASVQKLLMDLFAEAAEICRKRNATNGEVFVSVLKEQNQKWNAIDHLYNKRYGIHVLKYDGLKEYCKHVLSPELEGLPSMMKAKEYFKKYDGAIIEDHPVSFYLLSDLTKEMFDNMGVRLAHTDGSLFSAIREYNQKWNAISDLYDKKYGISPLNRNGFKKYFEDIMPELEGVL